MGLFLFGIPIALISAKVLCDDIKYTSMDFKTPKASHQLSQQYKQIDNNFAQILQYSEAKCDIQSIGYNKKKIKNVHKGQYGGMEQYLAEKGYYPQAIQYAKQCFDAIAEKEQNIIKQKREQAINRFENKLLTQGGDMRVVDFNVNNVNYPKQIIQEEVNRVIQYLHKHYNTEVFCNIIMKNDHFTNHQEVWHIKVPKGEKGFEYLDNLYNKLNIIYH